MAGESAIYKKFRAEQDAANAAYKKWEQEQWDKNGAEWTKQGYIRKVDSNNDWGSTWEKNPVEGVEQPPRIKQKKKIEEKEDPTKAWYEHMKTLGYKEEDLNDGTKRFTHNNNLYYSNGRARVDGKMINYDYKTLAKAETPKAFDLEAFRLNQGLKEDNYITHGGQQYLRVDPSGFGDFYVGMDGSLYEAEWGGGLGKALSDPTIVQKNNGVEYWGNYNSLYNKIKNFNVPTNKQGGTMNKVNYFQQGGSIKEQLRPLVLGVLSKDPEATQKLQQIVKQNPQIMKVVEEIAAEEQAKAQSQATMNKWGSKLQYIKSLKFAKGGKTCPVCEGGNKVKVAKKDIDKETYQRLSSEQKADADRHYLGSATSDNKDGSYNISHKPSAQDSTQISRKIMSKGMSKKYPEKKECGGKAKKHYFGGWL